jgi:hypothetical protein
MVDAPTTFSLSHFWIARISLFSNYPVSDREKKYYTRKISLAKQLIELRTQLVDSRGCDLAIKLATSELDKEGLIQVGQKDSSPQGVLTMTRLLLYGMSLMKPYREQIVSLQVFTDQPHILCCTFDLLASHLSSRSRLAILVMVAHPDDWVLPPDAITSLPEMTKLVANADPRSLWREERFSMTQSPSFGHLLNLDHLAISNSS